MTHDCKRNGISTLFAALNVLTGEVIGQCAKRHRHTEWLKFLRLIEKSTLPGNEIHISCDNYGTHKHPKVKSWLNYHKRFHVHFTPTSASWLNRVERFCRDLSERQLRRGIFRSVSDLEQSVMDYIERHNEGRRRSSGQSQRRIFSKKLHVDGEYSISYRVFDGVH